LRLRDKPDDEPLEHLLHQQALHVLARKGSFCVRRTFIEDQPPTLLSDRKPSAEEKRELSPEPCFCAALTASSWSTEIVPLALDQIQSVFHLL